MGWSPITSTIKTEIPMDEHISFIFRGHSIGREMKAIVIVKMCVTEELWGKIKHVLLHKLQ